MTKKQENLTPHGSAVFARIEQLEEYLQELKADGKILTINYDGKPDFKVTATGPIEASPRGILKNRIAKITGPIAVEGMLVSVNTLTDTGAVMPGVVFRDFNNPDSDLVGDRLTPHQFNQLALTIEAAHLGEVSEYTSVAPK